MRTKWRDGYLEWTGLGLQEFEMRCSLITALTNQAAITGILPVAHNCLILLFESHQDLNSWRAVPASLQGIAGPRRCLSWKRRVTTCAGVPSASLGGGSPRCCPAAPFRAVSTGFHPSSAAQQSLPLHRVRSFPVGDPTLGPSEEGGSGCGLQGLLCPSPAAPRADPRCSQTRLDPRAGGCRALHRDPQPARAWLGCPGPSRQLPAPTPPGSSVLMVPERARRGQKQAAWKYRLVGRFGRVPCGNAAPPSAHTATAAPRGDICLRVSPEASRTRTHDGGLGSRPSEKSEIHLLAT